MALVVLFAALAACGSASSLLTYGAPSDRLPLGWGIFDVSAGSFRCV